MSYPSDTPHSIDELSAIAEQWNNALDSIIRSSQVFNQNLGALSLSPVSDSFLDLHSAAVQSQEAFHRLTATVVRLTEIMASLFSNIIEPNGERTSQALVLKMDKDMLTTGAEIAGIIGVAFSIVKGIAPHLLKAKTIAKGFSMAMQSIEKYGTKAFSTILLKANTLSKNMDNLWKIVQRGSMTAFRTMLTGMTSLGGRIISMLGRISSINRLWQIMQRVSMATFRAMMSGFAAIRVAAINSLPFIKALGLKILGIFNAITLKMVLIGSAVAIFVALVAGAFIFIENIIAGWDKFKATLDTTNPIIAGIVNMIDKLLGSIKWAKDAIMSLFKGDNKLEMESTIVKNEKKASGMNSSAAQSLNIMPSRSIKPTNPFSPLFNDMIPSGNNMPEVIPSPASSSKRNKDLSSFNPSAISKSQNVSNTTNKSFNIAKIEINDGAITNLEDLILSLSAKVPNN